MKVDLKGFHRVRRRLAGGQVRSTTTPGAADRGGWRITAPRTSCWSFASILPTFDRQQVSAGPARGTIGALIHDYVLTPAVAAKASKTRRDYLHHIGHLEAEFGGKLYEAAEDPRARGEFLSCRDRVAGASDAHDADYRLAVLSEILSFGVDRGGLRVNQTRRPGRL